MNTRTTDGERAEAVTEAPRFARLERLATEVLDLVRAANDRDLGGRDVEVLVAVHMLELDLARASQTLRGVVR